MITIAPNVYFVEIEILPEDIDIPWSYQLAPTNCAYRSMLGAG